MLDPDPCSNQPPDPSSLSTRARPRSHKPKNAPKKQPQRGLGVAQLEKLRLEEQSKQQEAICFASLQHQNLHHHGRVHQQQEQFAPPFLHQHHPFQQQNLSQSSSLCLSRQIKLMEPPLEKASFSLPFLKLNVTQNSLLPLTVMASRQQTPSLPLLIPQQQLGGNEEEASLSPISNVPDLCSPCHVRPSSAESRLCPLLARTLPAERGENPWLSHLYDRDSTTKEKDSTITFLSSASCSDSDTRLQSLDRGLTESTNAAISTLNDNLHISMEKQACMHGGDGTTAPFTELCLSGRRPGAALDWYIPSRTSPSEPPPASIAAGGIQARELSSFQTVSVCPTWSPSDKVFNKKRSWACTQELASRQSVPVTFKGVDLNISVDEMESAEVKERDSNLSLPFTARDGSNHLPLLSIKKSTPEHKALLADQACRECGSTRVENAVPDMCFNGSAFLSLRKESLDHEKGVPEMSGEFLTLGPSCSSAQVMRNEQRCTGHVCMCHSMRKPDINASSWPCKEQAMGERFLAVTRAAGNNSMPGLMEYKPSYHNTSSQMDDYAMLSKTHGYSTCHLQQNNTDESLDLELRLSL